eukprot:TRINITY_DN10499_c0_g1_i1.p1 TRINITY_DN10499_c0_g1~~TRINITY_DN10499_c0_g1_i1.p1  ORF type:complete len:823 (+),score=281.40 TRINITY_DN10499_c0_g1_i1:308-2470(+)
MRPIMKYRAQYPRTVTEDRGSTWTADNLDANLPQRAVWANQSWQDAMIIDYIPQVPHTFASIEGLYGVINEKQVGIGESTCGSRFFAGPIGDDCTMCTAKIEISELSRIAMERASSAREAIQIMGDIAVELGFYGSEWDPTDLFTYLEAAESLTVTDPDEVWIFHISSDDTATSAVWVAQRVPDGHVSVVANQFIIRAVDPAASPDDMMFSPNLWDVAQRAGLWDPEQGMLDFTEAFAVRPKDQPHYAYSTRRVWRVLDMAAPSLNLSPYVDTMGDGLPFSVAPDAPLSPRAVLAMARDHYEGTPFDLSKGLAAGPYGDVDRYDPGTSADGSITGAEALEAGYFERSIGLFRTAYSVVTQSRRALPDAVGALVWVAQYKGSASTYVPMYVAADDVPPAYRCGSLFAYTKDAAYWAFSTVGNWMSKYRKYSHPDVAALQDELEGALFSAQLDVEGRAADMIKEGKTEDALSLLTETVNAAAQRAVNAFHSLFETFLARYHDGYIMKTPEAETIQMTKIFYPKAWLQAVGYYQTRLVDAVATSIVDSAGAYDDLAKAEISLVQAQVALEASMDYAMAEYSKARAEYLKISASHIDPPDPAALPGGAGDGDADDGDSGDAVTATAEKKKKGKKHGKRGRHDTATAAAAKLARVEAYDEVVRGSVGASLAALPAAAAAATQQQRGSGSLMSLVVALVGVVCGGLGLLAGQRVARGRHGYSSVLG